MSDSSGKRERQLTYVGLGLVTAATLMLQIALTRIFSVVMWYHMSLVSISIAMFGMTLGALIVEWRKQEFTQARTWKTCSTLSLAFGISICVGLALCLNIPVDFQVSLGGVLKMLLWNCLITVPFILSGIIVCAALTRFPAQTGVLYAADFAGAALGCLCVVWLLGVLDAPSAILALGSVGAFASAAFAGAARARKGAIVGISVGISILVLSLVNAATPVVRIQYVLGKPFPFNNVEREFWNVFSYVIESHARKGGAYWGPGRHAQIPGQGETKVLVMDTRAGTNLIRFDGRDWSSVRWLLDDATAVVHQLRDDGRVLVIGVGGGRDVLAALIHSQGKRQVDGVDINPRMIDLLRNDDRDFTGSIADLPNVSLHVDEARSWVERNRRRYQVITIPLVDTSAASAAGAYALTENNLYTLEAFDLYLRRLTPDGVLSISRWWWGGKLGEGHRLVAMAAKALRNRGATDPASHLIVIRGSELITVLVGANPFTQADMVRLKAAVEKSGFDVLFSPVGPNEPELAAVVSDPNWHLTHPLANYLNLGPATDDQPFFFHFFRLANVLSFSNRDWVGMANTDLQSMLILSGLILGIGILVIGVLAVPIVATWKRRGIRAAGRSFVALGYFAAIGLGFMFFESSQVQRLNIFLGYPVYALTVVLFTLLLFSSLGSFIASRLVRRRKAQARLLPLCLVTLAALALVDFFTHALTQQFSGAATPTRIVLTALLMAPPSVLMGMFLPMGLSLVTPAHSVSLSWCWAINGAMSTCAAVLAIAISITFGFSFTFLIAAACYAGAGVFSLFAWRSDRLTTVTRPSS